MAGAYTLVCPLWKPPLPPSLEDQIRMGSRAQRYWLTLPPACTFTDGETTDAWRDRWSIENGAEIARTWRCTTHNRRPRVYARSWNADRTLSQLATATYEQALAINPHHPHPVSDWTLNHYRERGTRILDFPPGLNDVNISSNWVWLSPIPPTPLHTAW